MARKNRRKFTLEFKLEAVRKVIVENRTYKDVGKEINVSESVQVRVMDDIHRSTLLDRHIQRGQSKLRAEVRRHRPSDDSTAPDVHHDG